MEVTPEVEERLQKLAKLEEMEKQLKVIGGRGGAGSTNEKCLKGREGPRQDGSWRRATEECVSRS